MNRKDFLLKSTGSVAALTVAGLLRSNAQSSTSDEEDKYWTFAHDQDVTKNGSEQTISHHFKIPKEASSCGDFTEIELSVRMGPKGKTDNLKIGSYTSELRKCKDKGGNVVWMKMCPYEWMKGEGILDDGIFAILSDKKTHIYLHYDESDNKKPYIEIFRKKKKDMIAKVDEYVPPVEDFDFDAGDCFLTTACTQHKGLADDCYELNTLRSFRDSFVAEGEDGQELIEAYYGMGPEIVAGILKHPKRQQILDSMYTDLVQPTVKLIESDLRAVARSFYIDYTLTLADALSN